MEQIIDLGFDRILTAGKKNSAIEGFDLINQLALKGKDRISIMPGSKLRTSNIDRFLENNLINDYHSSCYINNSFSIIELQSLIKKIYP
jgi:copper homeostasis protein